MYDVQTGQDRMMCPHCGSLVSWNGTVCQNCLRNKYEKTPEIIRSDEEAVEYVRDILGTMTLFAVCIGLGVWLGQPAHGGRGALLGGGAALALWLLARQMAVQIGASIMVLAAYAVIAVIGWYGLQLVLAIIQSMWAN